MGDFQLIIINTFSLYLNQCYVTFEGQSSPFKTKVILISNKTTSMFLLKITSVQLTVKEKRHAIECTTACSVSGRAHTRIRSVCVGLLIAKRLRHGSLLPLPPSLCLSPPPHTFSFSRFNLRNAEKSPELFYVQTQAESCIKATEGRFHWRRKLMRGNQSRKMWTNFSASPQQSEPCKNANPVCWLWFSQDIRNSSTV